MLKAISPQANRVFDAILRLEAKLTRRPFQQEIAGEAGYKSKSSANKYIKELETAGWLRRDYLGLNTLRPTG
jgi:SOS-response transcriptional repressor LexA